MADSQNDKITLTLDGAPKPELKLEPEEETAITIPKGDTEMDESNFTEEEKKMVEEFSETIDLRNSAVVLQYGASSQKKIADCTQSALESVRTKDLGEVGDMITDLAVSYTHLDVYKRQGQNHLTLPEGDRVDDGRLDLLCQQRAILLDKPYLRGHLHGDNPGQLQICLLYTSRCV